MVILVQVEAKEVRVTSVLSPVKSGVWSSRSGFLVCKDDDTAWCHHIREVIESVADSGSIWDDHERAGVDKIMVPVLPNDWNIYAKISLEKVGAIFRMQVRPYDSGLSGSNIDLGLLCPGDGRLQIRQMISDWISANIYVLARQCKSVRHSASMEMQMMNQCTNDRRAYYAHFWCIFWYGKCAHCLLAEGPGDAFTSAMIPDPD